MKTNDVLEGIIAAANRGGSGGHFLATSYLSWYRCGGDRVALNFFDILDPNNSQLFLHMLGLRKRPGWCDEELFACEKTLLKILKRT